MFWNKSSKSSGFSLFQRHIRHRVTLFSIKEWRAKRRSWRCLVVFKSSASRIRQLIPSWTVKLSSKSVFGMFFDTRRRRHDQSCRHHSAEIRFPTRIRVGHAFSPGAATTVKELLRTLFPTMNPYLGTAYEMLQSALFIRGCHFGGWRLDWP